MEYKRLGDYIEPIDERNSKLEVKLSQGINNNKYFQEPKQVAENSAADKIVRHGYFAYNRATTRNGEKISIAYREGPDCTVSSAYQVFRIKDEKKLNPKYLLMWYKRSDFDRYARFRSHGSAHEFFEYDEMCDVYLPLPDIDRQCEIVEEYETLSRRIRLNEQMIEEFEATAQALYRKMFIDGIDKENLPEGWRMGMLGEVADIKGGKRLPKGEELQSEKNTHPYIKVADMCTFKYIMLNDKFQYVEDDVQNQIKQYIVETNEVILSIVGTIGNVNVIDESLDRANLTENCVKLINIREVSCHYVYSYLTSEEGKLAIDQSIVGGVQGKLPIYNIEKLPLLIPSKESIEEFDAIVALIDNDARIRQKENSKLSELQSLLLAKMGRLKQ